MKRYKPQHRAPRRDKRTSDERVWDNRDAMTELVWDFSVELPSGGIVTSGGLAFVGESTSDGNVEAN